MDLYVIKGHDFYELLNCGYRNLVAHYQAINDLNVFPVPDGDTGTNMKLTYANGLKSITDDSSTVSKMSDEFARGMLFGARGNSGVLTSQYFRGFADALANVTELDVKTFSVAMISAYKNAYSACVDVTEGTILTVARESIENIINTLAKEENFISFLNKVVGAMRLSLDNTPNLLPVLKENGVVDSGGKGLLTIFEGFLSYFTGKEISGGEEEPILNNHGASGLTTTSIDYSAFNENSVLDYGYCTEFLLQLLVSKVDIQMFDIQDFIEKIQKFGDSLVCFQAGTIVKVHIHTKKPYEVIEFAQKYGEFVAFKMENMALQHNNVVKNETVKKKKRKKVAVVAVAQGEGVIELFKDLNCDVVLDGGSTMNTSVAELVDAFKFANADEIVLLPNETNMCKAAQQAAKLFKKSKVRVIETHTIQEGYSALSMRLGDEANGEECYQSLLEGAQSVLSCTVFKSGKDALIGDETAPKGAFVEAIGHNLVGYKNSRKEAVLELLENIENINEREILFIIYGKSLSEDEASEICDAINEKYPYLETGIIAGQQDVYDLLIGIN
mgnify:CR=1 FL=1